jgi:hypothetical protein
MAVEKRSRASSNFINEYAFKLDLKAKSTGKGKY